MKRLMIVITVFVGIMSLQGCLCSTGKCKGDTKTCIQMKESKKEGSAGKIRCCPDVKLEYLVPIAVGITAGCEKCTEMFVKQAMENGCSEKSVEEVIFIVDGTHKLECFREAVGQEIANRMEKPLGVGREILRGSKKEGAEEKSPCCPSDVKLEYLVPIAVGITAGCEKCTEMFVKQAMENGCPTKKVEEVISIVDGIRQLECFRKTVGEEIANRMEEPIRIGRETLKK